MKFYLDLDENKEPSVTVTCKKVTPTVAKIEELCKEFSLDEDLLYGYQGDDIVPLKIDEVDCFYTKDGKIYACVGKDEYMIKLRIKQVLEIADDSFIKINQGCVIKVRSIQNFTASFGGSLKVVLKNGYCDYVARREISAIKRRFGL